jgi:hypothetical protein
MLRRLRDDTGSLPLAMLLTLVGTGLSIALLAGTVQMADATQVQTSRVAALQAARTGLASALANIRAAADEQGMGLVSALPGCDGQQVEGSTGDKAARYETSILYLSRNPGGRSAEWAAANGQPCTTVIPRYAYVTSHGIAGNGYRRTLFGTYTFKSAINGNTAGGQIRVWQCNLTDPRPTCPGVDTHLLCMDAGSSNPVLGTPVRMQPCAAEADGTAIARQNFGYQPNLTIALIPKGPKAPPPSLCLDAGWPQVPTAVVVFERCGTTTLPRQQWSFNTASGFFGTSDGKTLNDVCLSVEQPDTPGSRVLLNDTAGGLGNGNPACNTGFPNNNQSWVPAPEVGAGAAGLPVTKQVVNYKMFGRCLDITYQDVTKPFEVVFPCKQTPDPEVRDWNQQWDLPAAGIGQVAVDEPDKGRYCLTAPPLSGDPLLVFVKPCVKGDESDGTILWNVRGSETPSNDEKYRIEGTGIYADYCLQPLPDQPAWQQADKVGLKKCTADPIQKWNAEAGSTPASFSNIGER